MKNKNGDVMKFLNLFCQGYAYAFVIMEFCILLNLIINFNKMDNKRRKFLLLQMPLFILIVFAIRYCNTAFDDFMIAIMLSIIVTLNLLIYSKYLGNQNS